MVSSDGSNRLKKGSLESLFHWKNRQMHNSNMNTLLMFHKLIIKMVDFKKMRIVKIVLILLRIEKVRQTSLSISRPT